MVMKKMKSIFKLAGLFLLAAGVVCTVLGNLDEIKCLFQKLAACKARCEEAKDFED